MICLSDINKSHGWLFFVYFIHNIYILITFNNFFWLTSLNEYLSEIVESQINIKDSRDEFNN